MAGSRRVHRLATAAVLLSVVTACASAGAGTPSSLPFVAERESGTGALLQAVSVVDAEVVWVSGHEGTVVRTVDGGRSWLSVEGPGPDTLQFRDVEARDARSAWLLSAGPGALSRVYHTGDGGVTWELQWTNPEPDGFYDCLAIWDDRHGVVYGDAVAGTLRVLVTEDGGADWRRVPPDRLPPALAGEGGFAASGSCVTTRPGGLAWIAAGNTTPARVFRTDDHGRSWRAAEVPVESGVGAGLTVVTMVDDRVGYALGGVVLEPRDARTRNVARTGDGGRSWTALPELSFPGPAYGGAVVPGTGGRVLVAVGPAGAAVSLDAGASWATVDRRAWWAAGSGGVESTWIAGPDGRIARLVW